MGKILAIITTLEWKFLVDIDILWMLFDYFYFVVFTDGGDNYVESYSTK
jgi:hypothetical protein